MMRRERKMAELLIFRKFLQKMKILQLRKLF